MHDHTVEQFLEELAETKFPTPAGGSAAGVSTAMASSLLQMACAAALAQDPENLSIQKRLSSLRSLREENLGWARKDMEAYYEVIQAGKKDRTGSGSKEWEKAIQAAVEPLNGIAAGACVVMEEAVALLSLSPRPLHGDLFSASCLAHGALQSCCHSMRINARQLHGPHYREYREEIVGKTEELEIRAKQLAAAIQKNSSE